MLRPALCLLIALPAFAAQPCEQLAKLQLPGVTITAAEAAPSAQVPTYCRVAGVIRPEVKFELWMPEQWNGKFMGVGNGGLAGTINTGAMATPLRKGYAVASTDTGHDNLAGDGVWAAGHMQRVVDFAHRGIHVTAVAAKAILAEHYATPARLSYFNGCSQGGQQALMLAQRYPTDYDGIIAGDPANFWTHHYIGGHIWAAQAVDGDGWIPPAKIATLAAAVVNQCDALDGVKDGLLSDPRRCHFQPATLQCKGADSDACLTAAQVKTVEKLYAGPGAEIYPGVQPGGEAGPNGWIQWITGTTPGRSSHSGLGIPFMRYVIFENPLWDFRNFRFDQPGTLGDDIAYTDAKAAALFNAVDPNLTPFKSHGGKLIQYHGWSDPDIPPTNSIDYYESVGRALGNTQDFYRLFMVPGMQHCSNGPGPTTFDMIEALDQWVDKKTAPAKVIASHLTAGTVDRTRPLCPYPTEAIWTGKGGTDDAANFTCSTRTSGK